MQRQILRATGATFHSERAEPMREFLASTDTWFRPVFVVIGPDGARSKPPQPTHGWRRVSRRPGAYLRIF
ncbi:MAG: hypothetical protein NTX09_13385 [Verrucomicrobia bacterium]|nr:hypothetical protein [Verrucomicrobiota bacterium]